MEPCALPHRPKLLQQLAAPFSHTLHHPALLHRPENYTALRYGVLRRLLGTH